MCAIVFLNNECFFTVWQLRTETHSLTFLKESDRPLCSAHYTGQKVLGRVSDNGVHYQAITGSLPSAPSQMQSWAFYGKVIWTPTCQSFVKLYYNLYSLSYALFTILPVGAATFGDLQNERTPRSPFSSILQFMVDLLPLLDLLKCIVFTNQD